MKLLLDTCISPKVATELVAGGHDVVWVGDWPSEPGDQEILAFALKDCLVVEIARKAGHMPLGTFDKDLGSVDGVQRVK